MLEESIQIDEVEKENPLPGIHTWINKNNGFHCLDLEYIADPEKRSEEWLLNTKLGMPRNDFEREFGKIWVVFDGRPVYPDFNDHIHVYKGDIVATRKQKLLSCFDAGPNDVYMAWVLGLVTPKTPSVLWVDEFLSEDGDADSFLEVVSSRLRMEWAKIGGFTIHVVDSAAFTKTRVSKERTAVIDTMRKYGIFPITGEISFSKRRQSVEELLVRPIVWTDQGTPIPRWRVHERCSLLIKAMIGGYYYPKNIGVVRGMVKPLPVKNEYSHIANAMEYGCSKVAVLDYDMPYEGRKLPHITRI